MDPSLLPAFIGAISGATVAAIGWIAVHALSSRRERAAAARDHLERQIQELYGPLLGLIQHSRLAHGVAIRVLPIDEKGRVAPARFSESDVPVWHFFIEEYFLPINRQIRQLVRSKMHLLEDGVLPKTFNAFFQHEVQFEALHRLWRERGLASPTVPGSGWRPDDFEARVQESLDRLRAEHQLFLRRLGAQGANPVQARDT